jgi:hypothetical protein
MRSNTGLPVCRAKERSLACHKSENLTASEGLVKISRAADLRGFFEAAEDYSKRRVVLLEERDRFKVSQILFELGRINDVAEHQRQQADAVLALELLHLGAMLQCNLQIHEDTNSNSAQGQAKQKAN